MNFEFAKLSPYGAATPPATILGVELYKNVQIIAQPVFGAATPFLAGFVAIVGIVGMMSGEIYSYNKAFEAFARKEIGAGLLSLAAALICSGMVAYAIYQGANTAVLISAVVFSVILYIAFGVGKFIKTKSDEKEKVANEQREKDAARAIELKAQVAIEQARARIATAEAKLAMSQEQVSENAPKVSETFQHWAKVSESHRQRISEACRSMSKADAVRWIAREYGKEPRTALNWYEYTMESK